MKPRAFCLSVSTKNEDTMDYVEEYSSYLGLNIAPTFFWIIKDHARLKQEERMRQLAGIK